MVIDFCATPPSRKLTKNPGMASGRLTLLPSNVKLISPEWKELTRMAFFMANKLKAVK